MPIPVQMARVPGGEQDTVKNLCRIHRAFVPTENVDGAVAVVLTRFVRPMPLHIVIMHPGAVDSEHLFPSRCPRELGVTHSSDDIEVRLNIILPCLPFLDTLFLLNGKLGLIAGVA